MFYGTYSFTLSLITTSRGPQRLMSVDSREPPADMVRKRSVVWAFFKTIDSESVQCLLCTGYLVRHEQGTTTNMLRHLRVKHPTEVKKIKGRIPECTSITGQQEAETDNEQFYSVEVALDDGDSDTLNTANDTYLDSAINGILEAAQKGPAEQITHEEASDGRPVRRGRNKRSLIWRHFERLDSLAAARCRICTKKIQCFEGSSTSNLRRHMSKRHPGLFSQLVADGQNPPLFQSSQGSHVNGDTSTSLETVVATEEKPHSGALKVSRTSEAEKRMFRRERELIEALRRTQREEARALEHQRELVERLQAVGAREAATEREQIESLRKAQLEEAKDLSRQKEELQREKAELQKNREQLQQEREELLFSRGKQAS